MSKLEGSFWGIVTLLVYFICCSPAYSVESDDDLSSVDLSIISWNVWFDQASSETRFPAILDELVSSHADIVFLQEVTPTFIQTYQQHISRNHYQLYTTPNAQSRYGLGYLTKQVIIKSKVVPLTSQYGRTAYFALLPISDTKGLVLINVHLESGQFEKVARGIQIEEIHTNHLPHFLAEVKQRYPKLAIVNTVWAGDFNLDGDEQHHVLVKYWLDAAITSSSGRTLLSSYDVDNNPLAMKTKSWFEQSSRLDRFYIPPQFTDQPMKYRLIKKNEQKNYSRLSDHYPIELKLQL